MTCVDVAATGKKIRDMRTAKGLTVRDMQAAFGFATPQAIYKWFRGAALPTVDNMVILADIFQCRIDDIVVVKKV